MKPFSICHPMRPHVAKGLCYRCYKSYKSDPNPELKEIVERRAAKKEADSIERALKTIERGNATRRSKWREYSLRRHYGLSVADYDRMLADQGGGCFICQKVAKRFNVDHCHASGSVRRILCPSCNNLVGVIEGDAERLAKAQEYVASYRWLKAKAAA